MENISEALYKDIRPYTLEKIVNIYNEKDAIHAIQRGLVWNTVRVEVLWDSLMRGIPIGTLSIRNKGGIYEILDGQQRACAMNMAFTNLPDATSPEEEKTNSLLWIDLGMYSATTENEQGNTTISERKFIFRVTTAAHPWGYELSDNETKTSVLDFPTQRKIVSELE